MFVLGGWKVYKKSQLAPLLDYTNQKESFEKIRTRQSGVFSRSTIVVLDAFADDLLTYSRSTHMVVSENDHHRQ